MTILQYIKADVKNVPKTLGYKINHNLAAIEDQEEALKKPYWAYYFAKNVPGADIRRCEEAACKDPKCACWFAQDIPGADIKKCEEATCRNPKWAYFFAFRPGADIRKCEEAACKDPYWAYEFARWVPGADREKCMRAAGKVTLLQHIKFDAKKIPKTLKKCRKAARR